MNNKLYLTGLLPKSEPGVFVNADGVLNVVLEAPNNPPDVVFAPNILLCPDCPKIPVPVLVPNPPTTFNKTHLMPSPENRVPNNRKYFSTVVLIDFSALVWLVKHHSCS